MISSDTITVGNAHALTLTMLVVAAGRHVEASGVDAHGTDAVLVSVDLHHLRGGERAQLADVGELWQEHAAVDVHGTLQRAGTEVEIETALVALAHEVGVW